MGQRGLLLCSINIINQESSQSKSCHHVYQAWSITLHLVQRLPEFLVYTVERGVISLALQLLQVVQPHPNKLAVADTTGRIIQLLVFLLQTKQS